MRNVLIIQYGRVLVKFYQIDRQRGDLCNHDPPQSIGHTDIGLAQNEFEFMRRHVQDLNFWKALMRHVEIVV